MGERAGLLRLALRLEAFTILWMFIEGSVGIVSGFIANSALLLAVGAGSAIDMFSACALTYLFRLEIAHPEDSRIEAMTRKIERLVGILLAVTAMYAVGIASYKLWSRAETGDSYPGIAVAAVASLWMPFLGAAKMRLAVRLESPALRGDGAGTVICGLMSLVLLLGLIANAAFHIWWLDAAGAYLLAPLLAREAREAWLGGTSGDMPH